MARKRSPVGAISSNVIFYAVLKAIVIISPGTYDFKFQISSPRKKFQIPRLVREALGFWNLRPGSLNF